MYKKDIKYILHRLRIAFARFENRRRHLWLQTLHERMDDMPEHLKYEHELFLDLPWPKMRRKPAKIKALDMFFKYKEKY